MSARPLRTRLRVFSMSLAAVLLVAGCGDDPTACPPCPGGAFEGRIVAPGGPVRAVVTAESFERESDPYSDWPLTSLWTETDESGAFSLVVPAGRYLLTVTPAGEWDRWYVTPSGLSWSDSEADMFEAIGGRPTGLPEMRIGSLEVGVRLDPAFEGRPIHLSARTGDGHGPARADTIVTAGSAVFRFAALPAGDYDLRLEVWGAEPLWLANGSGGTDPVPVRVEAGAIARASYELPDPPASLTGRVRGAWESSHAYTRVVCFGPDSARLGVDDVDSEGVFHFDWLRPVRVRVLLQIGDAETWVGGADFAQATEFAVDPGETVDAGEFEDNAILLRIGPSGFEGPARVRITDASGTPIARVPHVPSDLRAVAVHAVSPGTRYVWIEPYSFLRQPWLAQWYDGVDARDAATPIEVGGGTFTRLELTLVAGGTIRGTIVNGDGTPRTEPVRGVLTPVDEPGMVWSVSVSPSKQLELLGVPDGDYLVGASRDLSANPPTGVVYHPGTAARDSATVFSVRDHGTIEGIEVPLP